MDISTDYRDLFKALNRFKVKYLVVGAYAVIYYTEPRFTKDIDIWVNLNEDNVGKLYQALKVFGAPFKNISIKDFMNESMVYQMGVAPVRIDIMMGLPEIKFEVAWKHRKKSKYANTPINIIGAKELIDSKKKANRDQDVLDLKKLKKALSGRKA